DRFGLWIFCNEDRLLVLLSHSRAFMFPLADRALASLRFDDAEPREFTLRTIATGEVVFEPDHAKIVAAGLVSRNALRVEIEDREAARHRYSFRLAGADKVKAALQPNCDIPVDELR